MRATRNFHVPLNVDMRRRLAAQVEVVITILQRCGSGSAGNFGSAEIPEEIRFMYMRVTEIYHHNDRRHAAGGGTHGFQTAASAACPTTVVSPTKLPS